MNSTGQAFTIYKMLISVIFVFAVLMIIISTINYFDGLKLGVSNERLVKAIKQAVKQPNGDVFKVEDASFPKDFIITSENLSYQSGLGSKCFILEALDNAFEVKDSSIRFKSAFSGNIFLKCLSNIDASECDPECKVCCTFSAGKELIPEYPAS